MTTQHQPKTDHVAQPSFKQKYFLQTAREGWHSPARKLRPQQIITILALVGATLLLWAQPVAAAVSITEFKVSSVGVPQGITTGSDGALWFTEFYDNAIGRITTSGTITLTPTPTANSGPTDITAGPDGNMWFTEAIGNIGRITTS